MNSTFSTFTQFSSEQTWRWYRSWDWWSNDYQLTIPIIDIELCYGIYACRLGLVIDASTSSDAVSRKKRDAWNSPNTVPLAAKLNLNLFADSCFDFDDPEQSGSIEQLSITNWEIQISRKTITLTDKKMIMSELQNFHGLTSLCQKCHISSPTKWKPRKISKIFRPKRTFQWKRLFDWPEFPKTTRHEDLGDTLHDLFQT